MSKIINGKEYELLPEPEGNDLCMGCCFDQLKVNSLTRCAIAGAIDVQDCIVDHGIWKEVDNEQA